MSEETRKKHFGDVKPGHRTQWRNESCRRPRARVRRLAAASARRWRRCSQSVRRWSFPASVSWWRARSRRRSRARVRAARPAALIGALIGAGIPEDRAKEYERGINDGGILIGTRYRDADHAKRTRTGLHVLRRQQRPLLTALGGARAVPGSPFIRSLRVRDEEELWMPDVEATGRTNR